MSLSDSKLTKIERNLGKDTLAELEALSPDDLKTRIVAANSAIKQAVDELEANPQYTEIKENLKALSSGMREVKKRQNDIIQYSLSLIDDRGEK